MTTRKYSSRSQQTTLTSAVTSGALTIPVVNALTLLGGATVSTGQTFVVVIDPDTALEEVVEITAVSSNNLTVTRAVDMSGAAAQDHSAGAVVRHMIIGRDLREANLHIEATTAYNDGTGTHTLHGIASGEGDIVATDKTQTLTAKTLTAPTVNGATLSGTVTSTATLTGGTVNPTTLQQGGVQAVTTTGTQTLTNKTLTSPTITGTGAIAGIFTGNITGNVTGNVTGSSGSTTGNAATVTNGVYTTDTGTVTSTMIANNTILDADINTAAAITKTKISGTAVTLADVGTVTSTMIASDTIVNADINTAAGIAYSKLSLGGAITSADLVDGTIVNSDINASAAIALSKLATDPLARANHTGTQTASTVSDFDTQVRTSKVTDLTAPTGSFSMNSQKITTLADPTLAQDASTKAYVDAQITALVGGAPGTLDTLKEIADAISSGGSFESTVVLKSGSTMTGALTLSGAPSSNLHAATKAYVDTVAGSATAAAASAADAATTYDNFDDRYLGAKSTAPTVDNDGNALLTGALYWSTPAATMFAWSGSAWGSISSTAAIYRYRYTATGGETSKSGSDDNGLTLAYLVGYEQVYLNGVLLARTSDYTASNGTSITSLAALVAGDILEIITFTAFDLATAVPNTAYTAKGAILVGTAAGTYAAQAVGSNGQVLTANSTQTDGVEWTTIAGYSAPTLGSTSIASGATVTTIAGLTLTAPTLTGTVTASGDINLSAAGGPGSVIDELTLLLMGAL
jgi:hypothetical protein